MGRREVLDARPDLEADYAVADPLFPVRVTRSFWERIDPADPEDPLARQVLPDRREAQAVPGDLADPVGDASCSPVPWLVHKYPRRVLVLLTKRCHLYCRYCFRRTFDPAGAEDPSDAEWAAVLREVARIRPAELILSGGDPLAVRDERLLHAIDELRAAATPASSDGAPASSDGAPAAPPIPVRLHTRAPITRPDRITSELVDGLRARAPVWVLVHCSHPRELSPEVDAALAKLVDAGLPVLNENPLLRGVNDDPDTLAELFEALVQRRVFPYYLHHPDRVSGAGHFALSTEEGLAIYEAVRARVSGVALPRYVIDPPDGRGKVDVATWHAERFRSR